MNFQTLLSKLPVQLICVQSNTVLESAVFLFPAEQNQLENISSEKRKREFLGARYLRNELQINSIIGYKESGKPYLISDSASGISISHTSEFIAFGLAPFEIGIDLEKPQERIHQIINKFADEHEKNLYQFSEYSKTEWLTFIWCAKEAAYKLGGQKGVAFKEEMKLLSIEEIEPNYMKIEGVYLLGRPEERKVDIHCLKDNDLLFALARFKD
jgi:phosphopantetheinyl transferase